MCTAVRYTYQLPYSCTVLYSVYMCQEARRIMKDHFDTFLSRYRSRITGTYKVNRR